MVHPALRLRTILILTALSTVTMDRLSAQVIVDFEDLVLSDNSAAPGDATESPFVSRGASFNRTWFHDFDCCPGAWTYSNQTDLTTAGFGNPYSAYALPDGGGAAGSRNFAVADESGSDAVVTLPEPTTVEGMYVTNTTYTYLAVVDGNDGGGGFVKGPFSDGDWFRLDITGLDAGGIETGTVAFYLADYRGGLSYAASDWTWVDLSSLGDRVTTLDFALSSTDTGMFGMNTPALFAIDNLTLAAETGPELQAGDADQDLDFDQFDLIRVQSAAKYRTGQPATWGEGDWDGAPGGMVGNPPLGDGRFDQFDLIASQQAGLYLSGPYAAIGLGGESGDDQTTIVYDATTGEVAVDAPAGRELTSINIDSAAGIFTAEPAQNLGGSFDNDGDDNIFKATFGSRFGSISFGNVAQAGLAPDFVAADLTVVGSLAGGGGLGAVDLIYVPEPTGMILAVLGALGVLGCHRKALPRRCDVGGIETG